VTISVAETLNLQQEGGRIKGTSDRGFSLDGILSGPYEGRMPAAGLQETLEKHCLWVGNLSVPSGEGKRSYGKFTFGITDDCDYFQGNFEINGSQGWWKGRRSGSIETAPASYELAISPHSDKARHPLAIGLLLKENGKSVPNAKLKVHAFNLPGNGKKLADYFTVSSCTNCFWSSKGDKTVASICEGFKPVSPDSGGPLLGPTSNPDSSGSFEPNCPLRQTPLEVLTDGNGEAKLEFFLNLAELGDDAPMKNKPLSIPVKVEYWGEDGEKKIAEKEINLNLEHVGIVEGITFEAPPELDQITGDIIIDSITGKPKKQRTGNIADYSTDPGTNEGLKRSDRVKISEEALLPEGSPTGRVLKVNDMLYIGDKILINAENLKVTRGNMVMSGGLWVNMSFFDGFVGKVGVGGNVPSHVIVIGMTPEKTGFTNWESSFVHWGSTVGSEIDSKANPKSYMIKAGIKQMAPELIPYYTAYSKGKKIKEAIGLLYEKNPVYITIESAIAVDWDEEGRMLVTTREGNATIYTEATGSDGFAVPAGKTAVIPPDLMPILKDTDAKTAQDADDILAGLEDPALVGSGTSASGGASSGNGASSGEGATSTPGSGNEATGNATAGSAVSAGAPGSTAGPGVSIPGASGVVAPTNNNQIGDSAEISLDQSITQSINPAGSSNFYRFHADSPGILKLRLENAPAEMKPEMSLYDKNFAYVTSKSASNPGDSLTLEKDLSGPAWYYIEVKDGNGKAHSEPYSLKITFKAAPDRYEPNPNFFRAVEVQPGEGIEGYICPVNDEDFYKIYADTSGILKLMLDSVPADMKSELTLYDKGFGYMTSSTAANPGDSVSLEKDLQGPGWFFIKVRDADGKAHSEPYSLAVSLKSAPDQNEPNPNFFRATETATGQGVTAYICPVNDEDFYKFYVNGQQIVSIRLDSVPADMKGELTLYDKGFGYVTSSTAANPGDKVKLEKDVKGPGWFIIKVRDANGKAHSEPYSMTIGSGAGA
jgi:hypothetical protein